MQTQIAYHRERYLSLKARMDRKRSGAERLADTLTSLFGTMPFLLVNALWFFIWMGLNTGLVPGFPIFDPFPFSLLTMIVSLEAIFLSIIVLMSENRSAKINDLRDEVDLQVDRVTERELTKALELIVKIAEKQGIDLSDDAELQDMIKPINPLHIEKALEKTGLSSHLCASGRRYESGFEFGS